MKYQFEYKFEITQCFTCPVHAIELEMCYLTRETINPSDIYKKPSWCPLMEVKDEPCEHCGDEEKPFYHTDGPIQRMDSNVYIAGGKTMEIDLWQDGNSYACFNINFCPNCGRKLRKDEEK